MSEELRGWFDEQIRARIDADNETFSEALGGLSGVINDGEDITASDAEEEITRYYHAESFGQLMRREVELKDGWYKDAAGAYLGTTKDGRKAALIPGRISGYSYKDYATGKRIRLNRRTQNNLESKAVCFYKPLPEHELHVKDVALYIMEEFSFREFMHFALVTVLIMLVSMITPQLTQHIYSDVIPSGNLRPLVGVVLFMAGVNISVFLLRVMRSLMLSRVEIRTDINIRAALMMRLINLPAEFFRKYSSGELAQRISYVNLLCSAVAKNIFSVLITALVSLVYIQQIFSFSPALVSPAVCVIISLSVFSFLTMRVHAYEMSKKMNFSAQENGLLYAFMTGIQKIKLTGAEKRAFGKWAKIYRENAKLEYNPPLFIKINSALRLAILSFGTFAIYFTAQSSDVAVNNYMAFMSSFALFSGAFIELCDSAVMAAALVPMFELVRPILEALPEVSEHKKVITHLSGNIEMSNVTFRYNDTQKNILDGLSLKIRSGDYVAIVGKSGCGKSTLLRLLLGFEHPQRGVIYYDRHNLRTIDPKSLRAKIGCVMQNSKLFTGSIYENIAISAPGLSEEAAWEAAEVAGIADDIRKMPMMLNTMISEGAGTISGGQRQRIIIARAMASKPRILLFDEATSALDNITQKKVSDALDKMKCTRIVIAHRLSTIRNCKKIFVLDGGRIVEEGTFEELTKRGGIFAGLVERQRLPLQ